uniref:Ig-like domain-containing protein n=1 Tax=Gouania willdenowi TaxID=441366 RepID=A0A8C5DV15_GOUWI
SRPSSSYMRFNSFSFHPHNQIPSVLLLFLRPPVDHPWGSVRSLCFGHMFLLLQEPTRVLEGDIARFRCRVTGYPAPKVNWYLNGQLIRKSKRYRLRYDGIYYLEIVDIKSYDAGEVRVVADNPLGTTEHTVKTVDDLKFDNWTMSPPTNPLSRSSGSRTTWRSSPETNTGCTLTGRSTSSLCW